MSEHEEGPVRLRIMSEYSVDVPLWEDGGLLDEDLPLSESLLRDLRSFAARWDANVPPETYDDRFDAMPPVRRVVDTWRVVRWRLRPIARRRAVREAVAEDEAMRALGEELRARVQAELGDGYRVVYRHG